MSRGAPPIGPVPAGEPYRQGLSLDAIGQPTLSGSMSAYGARFAGGISAVFSDTLGDRGLGVQAQIGGSLSDIGGELLYINRRHRWNWAVSAAAAPQSAGYLVSSRDPVSGETRVSEIIDRQPVRGVFGMTAYPFSASTRLEVSGGVQSLSFSREIRSGIYDPTTRRLVDVTREQLAVGDTLYLRVGQVALVRDTSYFGATSPIYGSRSRFEIGRTSGTVQYTSALADWRRYFMPVRPFTVAVRGLHFGRRGPAATQLLMYAGHPGSCTGMASGRSARSNVEDGLALSRRASATSSAASSAAGCWWRTSRSMRRFLDCSRARSIHGHFRSTSSPSPTQAWRGPADRPSFAVCPPGRAPVGAAVRVNLFRLLSSSRRRVRSTGSTKACSGRWGSGKGILRTASATRLTAYASRLTPHGLRYGSRLTAHGSRLTAYGSRLTPHGLRLTAHGSRLTLPGVVAQSTQIIGRGSDAQAFVTV
jgi:hypothetical protein